MVFIQLPTELTEEEEMLKRKYQKLKKKKKALQQLKAPKPEPPPIKTTLKKTYESGKDAKEVAKNLLKSGKIHAIKAPDSRERQDSGFKRSISLERKRGIGVDKPGGYQPFPMMHSIDDEPNGQNDGPTTPKIKPLYESFVSSRDPDTIAREETLKEKKRDGKANYINRDSPQQGNTIYVWGIGVNESILRSGFSVFGNILNITAEVDKNCGFITFDTINSANRAIDEMDKKLLNNIKLKVTLARRQPNIVNPSISLPSDVSSQSSTTSAWSTIAASYQQKVTVKEKRDIVSYEETDIFN